MGIPVPDSDDGNDQTIRVIMPGSKGLALVGGNRVYHVEWVYFNPRLNALCYRGRYEDQQPHDTSIVILPVTSVVPIPGESRMGRNCPDRGELEG